MKKILVIEDEPAMRSNLVEVLELEGFETAAATDGRDGVARARDFHPDLILCDVMMPGMDGYAVLKELRAHSATANVPFIFITAKGERVDVRAGMNLGADDYLVKPVSVRELIEAVQARLQRKRAMHPSIMPIFKSHEPLQELGISPREAEILFWTAQGKTNAEMGLILDLSRATVKTHLERIYRKLGCENRSTAALRAVEVLSAHQDD